MWAAKIEDLETFDGGALLSFNIYELVQRLIFGWQLGPARREAGPLTHITMTASSLDNPPGNIVSENILYLAARGGFSAFGKLLIRNAAMDPNQPFENRDTAALHVAASAGRHEFVMMLLEHGADVFLHDGRGQTALRVAEVSGHTSIVRLLEEEQIRVQEREQKREEAAQPMLQSFTPTVDYVWQFLTGRRTKA